MGIIRKMDKEMLGMFSKDVIEIICSYYCPTDWIYVLRNVYEEINPDTDQNKLVYKRFECWKIDAQDIIDNMHPEWC